MSKLNGVVFSVATDSSNNELDEIGDHQQKQVDAILKNLPRMKYDGGKKGIQLLANELASLSPQLYAQLHCQINLIDDLLRRGTLYYVQRQPRSLGKFRWRVDQKNSEKPVFEAAFEKLTPALLQSKTIDNPAIFLEGADYSAFDNYRFREEEVPTYLEEEYGIEINTNSGINLGKLLREDLCFEDSKQNWGVQLADLLASGLRRCLRGNFNNNAKVAWLLGSLMISNERHQYPIRLIGFRDARVSHETSAHAAVNIMIRSARAMLAH